MKRIHIALVAMCLALNANAQNIDDIFTKSIENKQPSHVKGEIPVVDGKVVLTKTLHIPGRSRDELYAILGNYVERRYEPTMERGIWQNDNFFKNTEFSNVKTADRGKGEMICQGAEELVFKQATLVKDWTEVYYKAVFDVTDENITMTLSNIFYIYKAADGSKLTAEEWITDDAVFTKRGKIRTRPAKFRAKTLKLMDGIIDDLTTITQK